MVDIPDINSKLLTRYNNIEYYDDVHKYYLNGKECISVTTLIHKYVTEFDELYWSEAKAEEFNLTPKEVLRAWKFLNEKGTFKGSLIHEYGENLFKHKFFPYPSDRVINMFGFDPIKKEYDKTKKHVDKFYNDVKDKLIPVHLEGVYYDEEALIAGMADILFYNVRKKQYQIWDYKTNKDFTFGNDFGHTLKYPLNHLADCDIEIYSLQLALYKLLIEKHTGLKIGDSYLIWVSHRNNKYELIKTYNRDEEIKKIYVKRLMEVKFN
ncbi:MAG: hypothetical protein ACOCVF_00600 [bacterium]